MDVSKIHITDITPADYNPRLISEEDYDKLKNSIGTFGLVDPIIINLRNNHIIGGHQRYDVLLDEYDNYGEYEELTLIRLGDVGLVFQDKELNIESDAHEKALNLALNKINGDWDTPKLEVILEELELSPIDIELTGFSEPELKELDITNNITNENNDVVEDDYEEPDEIETNIQHGDLFRLGDHYLFCGDATLEDDVKALLDGGGQDKIDMVFTDPPYGMCLDTDWSNAKYNLKFASEKGVLGGKNYPKVIGDNDDFTPKLISTIFNNFDYCKEIFLWGGDYYSELIPNRNEGSWFVWDKRSNDDTSIENAEQADKMFGSCFELCWSKNKHKREIIRIKWAGIFGTEQEFDHKRYHPTQKPIKLSATFINRFSNENNTVLDLFGGSGSTLIACEQLNRNCYMMELDPHYCQVIINRWEEFTGDEAIKIN